MERLLKLIFHHIPKTGGTFLIDVFKESINHCRINFDHMKIGDGRSWIDSNCAEFYSSHWAFSDFTKKDDEFYFTWLRNPIDMFYSGWYYYKTVNLPVLPINLIESISNIKKAPNFDWYLDYIIDNNCDFFPKCVLGGDLNRFDFVGFADEMDISINKLADILGINLPQKDKIKTNKRIYDHRRDDVHRILIKETDDYLSAKNILCQST